MTEPTALDLTQVKGVAVISRQPAWHKTPLTDAPTALTGIDQVLLADESVVYQCVYEQGGCGATFAGALSARAHLTRHSPRRAARRAQTEALKQREQRAANGRKGAETRRTNAAKPKPPRDEATKALLAQYYRGSDMVNDGFRLIEDAVHKLSMLPGTDPKVLEKAAKYDQLRKSLIG